MKVRSIETLHTDSGWRNYHFVKLITEDGVVGWSEYDEHQGAIGVTTVIEKLAPMVIGERVHDIERVYARLHGRARQSMSGVMAMGIGAIENALLDAKAKTLGVPCYDLLGGKVRDRVRVYWSHCGTWRISRGDLYPPPVKTLDDVRALGQEVRERGFTGLKTNIFDFSDVPNGGRVRGWAPGFGSPYAPDRNAERHMIRELRQAPGGVPGRRRARTWTSCSTSTTTHLPRATGASCGRWRTLTCSGWRSTPSTRRLWPTSGR